MTNEAMTNEAMTKAVQTTEELVPSYIKAGAARGNENITSEDIQLPRLDVLQALSPQVNKKNDAYIDGAETGMIFNTLTHELYPNGVRVTPVYFTNRYLVWVDRTIDSNGGLRGVFTTQQEAEAFVNSQADANKLEVVKTAEHIVILDDGSEAVVSMAKSKVKVSRKWNSLIRLNGGDRFSRSYLLTAVTDSSSKGEFMNLDITNNGFPSEKVYLQAEKMYESLSASNNVPRGNYNDIGGDDY